MTIMLLFAVTLASVFYVFSANDHNDNMYIAALQLNKNLQVYKDFYFCQAPASLLPNALLLDIGNDFLSAKIFNVFLYLFSLFLLALLLRQASVPWEYSYVAVLLLAFSDYFSSGFFGYGNYAMPLILLAISYLLKESAFTWKFLAIGFAVALAAVTKVNYALFYFIFLFAAYQDKKLVFFFLGNLFVAFLFFDFFYLLITNFNGLYGQLVDFHYQTNAFRFADAKQHWFSFMIGLAKWMLYYSGLYKLVLVVILFHCRRGLGTFDFFLLLLIFLSVVIPKVIWSNYTIQAEFFFIYFSFKQLYRNKQYFIALLTSYKVHFLLNKSYLILAIMLFVAGGFLIHKNRFSFAAFNANRAVIAVNNQLKLRQNPAKPIITISGIFLSDIDNIDKRSSMGAFLERLVIFERQKQIKHKKKTGFATSYSIVLDSLDTHCQYLTGYYGKTYSEDILENRLAESHFIPTSLGFFQKNEIKLWEYSDSKNIKKR